MLTSLVVHYRGRIELTPALTVEGIPHPKASWYYLVGGLLQWTQRRVPDPKGLSAHWFRQGGQWERGSGKLLYRVATASFVSDDVDDPNLWAFRFEHPDSEFPYRRWRVDVSVETLREDHFRLAVQVLHGIRTGYIGEEPQRPDPSVPGIVSLLLRPRHKGEQIWNVQAGSESLTNTPHPFGNGHGREVWDRIEDAERDCPLVLLTRKDGELSMDPDQLAEKLAGAASVYAASDDEVNGELRYYAEPNYQCTPGMVRVYQPRIRPDQALDARRHRFFLPKQIEHLGEKEVRRMLIAGLVRRGRPAYEVVTLEQVEARVSRRYLVAKQEEAIDADRDDFDFLKEYVTALESDNENLLKTAQHSEERAKDAEDRIEDLEFEVLDLRDEIQRAQSSESQDLRFWRGEAKRLREENATMKGRAKTLDSLDALPKTVREVADHITLIHRGRIAFTARGLASADEASFNDPATAWKCLWGMATKLHALYFDGVERGTTQIEQEFRRDVGFELSHSEGKTTKADKKLMQLREDIFDGQTISIVPHVKIGTENPTCLRVHYAVLRDEELIVIGHCGDHLDTAGTRRRN